MFTAKNGAKHSDAAERASGKLDKSGLDTSSFHQPADQSLFFEILINSFITSIQTV